VPSLYLRFGRGRQPAPAEPTEPTPGVATAVKTVA